MTKDQTGDRIYSQSKKAGGKPEIHIGPATHLEWWEGTQELQLKFFKHHLQKPGYSDFQEPKQYFWNLTSKKWQTALGACKKDFYFGLHSTGLACLSSSEGLLKPFSKGSGALSLVHDPWRPAPSIGGHLSPSAGEVDRKQIDKRSDVATFTSAPFTEFIHLEGKPSLELEVFSDQRGFDLCIALSIINAERNKVTQLSTGILRVLGKNAQKSLIREIKLFPFLADFDKGTSIRISIAGAAWPAIGINSGDEKIPCEAPSASCMVTTICFNLNESKLQFTPLIDP